MPNGSPNDAAHEPAIPHEPERKNPDFIPVPTDGWLGKRYRANVRRGNPMKVPHLKGAYYDPTRWARILTAPAFRKLELASPEMPQLSVKEYQAIVTEQARLDAIWRQQLRDYDRARANHILLELCHKVRKLRVVFINSKGGGATTTLTAWSVSVFGDSTRVPSLTVADFNPARGTLADRLDRESTIDLRGMVDKAETMEDFDSFGQHVGFTKYGVQVVSATSIIKKDAKLDGDSARTALRLVNKHSRYQYYDTPNDITHDVSLAVFEEADVFVFTANVGVHDSMRHLASSMDTLREHGFGDKVDHSVVAISNIPEDKSVEDYLMYLDEVDMRDRKIRDLAHLHKGPRVGIRHDDVVDNDSIVTLEALQPDTYRDFQELNIAIFRAAPQFKGDRSAAEITYNELAPEREIFRGFAHITPPSH